jgi:flagellar biosynthesis/type III secretory pathway chaperone
MIDNLHNLITALREELKHYGEMLALLDQQQEWAMARATDDLLQSVSAIQAQGAMIQTIRIHRERCQRAVAMELHLPDSSSFADLNLSLPMEYRPLLQALVQENNDLLARVQHRARQNHLLLSRTVELMRDFVSSLFPAREMKTYNERGDRMGAALTPRPIYEAVG